MGATEGDSRGDSLSFKERLEVPPSFQLFLLVFFLATTILWPLQVRIAEGDTNHELLGASSSTIGILFGIWASIRGYDRMRLSLTKRLCSLLKPRGGTCNSNVSCCSLEDQKICCKKAVPDTFIVPHPQKGPSLAIPLKAYHLKDGFGKSALRLQYSSHLGEAALIPFVIEYFGIIDDELGCNAKGLTIIPWCIATSPVHDLTERLALRVGEAVFNITKSKAEVDALLQAGIISETGRKVQMGFYPPHPVCRINLPFAEEEEHE